MGFTDDPYLRHHRALNPDDPYDDEFDGIFPETDYDLETMFRTEQLQREINAHEAAKRERYRIEEEQSFWRELQRQRRERLG